MFDNLSFFTEEDETKPLPVGEWSDDLTWSPSQCYCRVQYHGVDYILYLRWRWRDPWQAHVVKNATSLTSMNYGNAVWSGDVFKIHNVYLKTVELGVAKKELIRLFYEFDGTFTQLRLLLATM